jgi:pyridoxal phosphate enzyme (YggS family)
MESHAVALQKIRTTIPKGVKLIAVSKTKPIEEIMEVYEAGHLVFGENKAQELRQKYELMPKDVEWHFIGHLQSNKVKYITPFVSLIHSIDSLKLLAEVDKSAKKNDRIVDCLLQFHIAEEDTKFGLDLEEAKDLLSSEIYREFKNVRICGVMGMATFTDDEVQVRREFAHLKSIFDVLKGEYFSDSSHFKEISMGMTDDYRIAMEEGSTMVRIGSAIFGHR